MSPGPSARPPAAQRAGALEPGAEQLDLHAEFADALHGGAELAVGRIGFTLLERALERGLGLPAPLLELEHRQAEFAGKQLGGLAAQQAQHHLALARNAPPLAGRQRAGLGLAWRRRGSVARGQRGRAAPARADHRPINHVRTIDLVHGRLHHSGLSLDKWVSRETGCSSPAVAAQTSLIKQRLLSSTVLASDETSVRVGKKTFWTWVFHHADSACFVIRPSRGKAVVREFLGDVRPAVWISDRLGAQRGWASRDHQVCLAHLLRDVQYAIDAGDAAFAPGMKHLLQRAVRIGHRRPALADATLAAYHARLQRALDDLLKIVPDNKPGLKLQRIIKRFRQSLFVFLTDREASPTNNGSEQALRPCVIFRKVTNGFRSAWGADLYADVRSVLESARRRGVGILHALRLTLDGQPLPTAA